MKNRKSITTSNKKFLKKQIIKIEVNFMQKNNF